MLKLQVSDLYQLLAPLWKPDPDPAKFLNQVALAREMEREIAHAPEEAHGHRVEIRPFAAPLLKNFVDAIHG